MREKGRLRETFFRVAGAETRPKSVHTEFMETDWEIESESEIYSEVEDLEDAVEDGQSSPRVSVGSVSF